MTMKHRPIAVFGATAIIFWVLGSVVAPARPIAQPPSFELVASMPGPADHVEFHDGYAYVSADKTFSVVDVSEPTKPVRLGSHLFPEQIWGFRLSGTRAFVGANFFGLGVLDISDPAAPTLLGSFDSLGQTKIGDIFNTTVALIDHMEGVVFLDVADEARPEQVGSFYLDGYARDLVMSGSMVYAVDSPTGLYIFDVSDPGPWEPVGILHAPAAPQRSLQVFTLSGGNGERILLGAGAAGLQVFDVSDPAAPTKLVAFDTPGQTQSLVVKGDLAYVADGQAGLQIVDLSNPSAPRVVGGFETERPARDVAVAGSLVLVVVGEGDYWGDDQYDGTDREVLILRQTS